ncbi:hypothetical protein THAOC_01466 [Thalassiosira oceanica]|uniref:Uncharacterized protein n=1 Tax=Thalassiosira oceanica TaxID=159749 RepID=K0TH87_THAOC|nr:hypothetical protein THAOC_01466 [Thalassiosira oceanica]|eukprot:EJK76755.1 hypothetical protein THAOC_01466 [Thalassiosira oceanica]
MHNHSQRASWQARLFPIANASDEHSARRHPQVPQTAFSERGSLYLAGYELELTQSEKESLPPQIARLSATKIGCVKGGFEQINNRKKAFQTASPFPFRIQHVFSCRYHYQVETFWKTHFKPKLVGNGGGTEWFHLDASDIDLVSSEMEKYASTGMLLGGHISNEPRKSSVVGQPAEQRPREKVRAILYKHKCFLKAFKESRSYLSSTEFELVLKALYKHPRSLEGWSVATSEQDSKQYLGRKKCWEKNELFRSLLELLAAITVNQYSPPREMFPPLSNMIG